MNMSRFYVDARHFFIVWIKFFNYLYCAFISSFLFDVKIFRIFHSNSMIGLCYAMYNIGSLSVLFTPLIRRKIVRDLTFNIANLVSYIFTYISIYALYIKDEYLFLTSLFILAFSLSIVNKIFSFMLVGDLNKKDRDNILTLRKFMIDIAYTLGNLLSYILFKVIGDGWDSISVKYVLILSQSVFTVKVLMVVVYFIIYMRKDTGIITSTNNISCIEDNTKSTNDKDGVVHDDINSTDTHTDIHNVPLDNKEVCGNMMVPWIITLTALIYSIGSGLSVKYFVVYMVKSFGLKPAKISLISIMDFIILSILVLVSKYIEKYIGGPLVIIIAKAISFGFLISFISAGTLNVAIVCYMLRSPIQNCTRAISTSIMLAHTNKKGYRWWLSSIELILVVKSISSFIGGIISDKFGYKTCFVITATLYGIAQCAFIPCYFLHKIQ